MIESGYYPPGAEFDPNAPYNQVDPPEHDFDVTVSQTLSRNVTITTQDYSYEEDIDEDGAYVNYNTEDTDWKSAYVANHCTIEHLLSVFKSKLIVEKSVLEAKLVQGPETVKRIKECEFYISECEGWCVDDFEVVQ